jgi:hypothetical protein
MAPGVLRRRSRSSRLAHRHSRIAPALADAAQAEADRAAARRLQRPRQSFYWRLIPAAFAQELPKANPSRRTVTQQIRVEEKFALATAKDSLAGAKGQRLPTAFRAAF